MMPLTCIKFTNHTPLPHVLHVTPYEMFVFTWKDEPSSNTNTQELSESSDADSLEFTTVVADVHTWRGRT